MDNGLVGGQEVIDVAIVGGGPAGLSAALLLGRCRRSVVVYDDGKPRNKAALASHGLLTQDGKSPADIRQQSRLEVARYGVTVRELGIVTACQHEGPRELYPTSFCLTTSSGETMFARKLLIAVGVRDELPKIPGVQECYGVSVHHCPYCD